jgi:hypothetical protein
MKEFRELAFSVIPFMVSAVVLFPLLAIVGGGTDPFAWQREDRVFYFICTVVFGWMLFTRIRYVHKEEL